MSLAIAHFAVGTVGTALLLALVAPRLVRSPTPPMLGGVWGMVPDLHQISPVATDALRALHRSSLADLFWFHGFMDRVDPLDSFVFAGEVVAVMVVALPVVELYARWRLGAFDSESRPGVSGSKPESD